ncbi:hypothetical protein DNTS_031758 [Danionella cerebrum]|uniref:Uncharacterized protein n=1 Tax=Danionella cerebrum TaxID=2873325 RepID=A0A553QBE7_9TELE|nr:hypothetical protein DNTS_031758 [Danionella translucida]
MMRAHTGQDAEDWYHCCAGIVDISIINKIDEALESLPPVVKDSRSTCSEAPRPRRNVLFAQIQKDIWKTAGFNVTQRAHVQRRTMMTFLMMSMVVPYDEDFTRFTLERSVQSSGPEKEISACLSEDPFHNHLKRHHQMFGPSPIHLPIGACAEEAVPVYVPTQSVPSHWVAEAILMENTLAKLRWLGRHMSSGLNIKKLDQFHIQNNVNLQCDDKHDESRQMLMWSFDAITFQLHGVQNLYNALILILISCTGVCVSAMYKLLHVQLYKSINKNVIK